MNTNWWYPGCYAGVGFLNDFYNYTPIANKPNEIVGKKTEFANGAKNVVKFVGGKVMVARPNSLNGVCVMPEIVDVRTIENNGEVKVVVVSFADGTSEKAVLSANDTYSLEYGISICVTKRLLSEKCYGHGNSVYNKIVRHGLKVYENAQKKAAKNAEEAERIKTKMAKLAQKKAEKRAKSVIAACVDRILEFDTQLDAANYIQTLRESKRKFRILSHEEVAGKYRVRIQTQYNKVPMIEE